MSDNRRRSRRRVRRGTSDSQSSISSADTIFTQSTQSSNLSSGDIPSLGQQTFVEQFARAPGPAGADALILPCEFAFWGYAPECTERFRREEVEEWIQHHLHDHMDKDTCGIPEDLMCPVCDEFFVFNSKSRRLDVEDNFRNRMIHWASHYLEGGNVSAALRRDYALIKHLGMHKLIGEEKFESEMGTTEIPVAYRDPFAKLAAQSSEPVAKREEMVEDDMREEEKAARRARHPRMYFGAN